MRTILTLIMAILFVGQLTAQSTQKLLNRNEHSQATQSHLDREWNQEFNFNNHNYPGLAPAAIKKRLDSIYTEVYDDSLNQMVQARYGLYSYHFTGKLLASTDYYWNAGSSQWEYEWKTEYTYDSASNIASEISFIGNGNLWVNIFKTEYSYNTMGQITERTQYEWDMNQWVPDWKEEYFYDLNNLLIMSVSQNWDSSQNSWNSSSKTENSWDSNGNMIELIGYYWDDQVNQWVMYWKEQNSFNTSNDITEIVAFYYDQMQWNEDWKESFIYDSNGFLIQNIEYSYDQTNSVWINESKELFTVGIAGNREITTYYEWNHNLMQWEENWKEDLTHDTLFLTTDLILPLPLFDDETGYLFSHKLDLVEYFEWESASNQFQMDSRHSVFYSDVNTGIREHLNQSVKVYPNPATSFLNFDLYNKSESELGIFNIQGQLIYLKNGRDHYTVPVDKWSSGTYIFRVIQDNHVLNGKIIVN